MDILDTLITCSMFRFPEIMFQGDEDDLEEDNQDESNSGHGSNHVKVCMVLVGSGLIILVGRLGLVDWFNDLLTDWLID